LTNGGSPFPPGIAYPPQGIPQRDPYPPRYGNEPAFQPPPNAPAWQPGYFAQQAAAPAQRPLIRLKGPDEDDPVTKGPVLSSKAPLRLPSPAELGIVPAAIGKTPESSLDWADAHRRADRLGALSVHQEKLPSGGFQVIFLLPYGQSNRGHQIEARGDTPAEAFRLALEHAEKWARGE
jgi:hypothetical protein